MGLDVGDRTIGVALSDETGTVAQGLQVLRRSGPADVARVVELAREHGAAEIVVGLPRTLTGAVGPQAEKVLAFVAALREASPVPVATWDERLSTRVAERVLIEADLRRERRKEVIDRVAAAVILQGYLDARRNRGSAPEGAGAGGM
jgi:putative Holliday junction resolvase